MSIGCLCFVLYMPSSLSFSSFFFNDTATTEIYTLSLHDALPIFRTGSRASRPPWRIWTVSLPARTLASKAPCRSEEYTSELQSQSNLVCRLLLEKKKKTKTIIKYHTTYKSHSRIFRNVISMSNEF